MLDIEALRQAYGATSREDWFILDHRQLGNREQISIATQSSVIARIMNKVTQFPLTEEDDANAFFIAIAHRLFPEIISELDRLQGLEAELDRVVDRANDLETTLANLVDAINADKDGGYFLCEEAEPIIEHARNLLP